MKIESLPIEELKVYENNPRRIPEEAIDAVANSIREFGFKVPIIVDSERVIIAGHTRLLAAEKLGLEDVPCIVAVDLSPEQVKAFRLADNKTCELSGWDFEKLEAELAELKLDMSDFGFEVKDEIDVDSLFAPSHHQSKESPPRTMICPNCGAEIEIKE